MCIRDRYIIIKNHPWIYQYSYVNFLNLNYLFFRYVAWKCGSVALSNKYSIDKAVCFCFFAVFDTQSTKIFSLSFKISLLWTVSYTHLIHIFSLSQTIQHHFTICYEQFYILIFAFLITFAFLAFYHKFIIKEILIN